MVLLNKKDMEELSISGEDLIQPRLSTLRMLERLLRMACLDTGFCPATENLLVQVQSTDSGCRIIFTTVRDTGDKTAPAEPVIFAFEDIDDVLCATSALFEIHSHRIFKSSLYQMDASYRLLVRTLDTADGPVIAHLEQYGRKIGQGELAAAFLDEHGAMIIEDDAIDRLAAISGKSND